MPSRNALFALLALWGVATLPASSSLAQGPTPDAPEASDDEESEARRLLVNRVWQREGGDLPGVIRIFLSDGTLVQDSCWETHRLSPWVMTSDTALSWNEDGIDIPADILSLSDAELVLRLHLIGGETQDERYAPVAAPYICPDMPR